MLLLVALENWAWVSVVIFALFTSDLVFVFLSSYLLSTAHFNSQDDKTR